MRSKHLAFAALIGIAGCGGNGTNPVVFVGKTQTIVAGGADAGKTDGPLATATFRNPANVAVDARGTVFVADFDNNAVRAIKNGVVSTIVEQANFSRPFGLTVAADGTLYVQTDANDLGARNGTTGTVWKVNQATATATVVARDLGRPRGLLALPDGRIAMANLSRNTIELLDPTTGAVTLLAGEAGSAGFANGTGAAARFSRPYGMARLSDGSLLVADQTNNRIRKVTMTGVVTTFAGTGTAGATDGPLGTATLNGPQDVDIARDGRIFIADTLGKKIRVVAAGQMSTYAGDGTAGFQEGAGAAARFNGLEGMAITADGATLFVADGTNGEDTPFNRVRFFRL